MIAIDHTSLSPLLWSHLSAAPTSAYVHIPFCRRRCYYCDFAVSIVGDRLRGETSGTIAEYVKILCQEILATPNQGRSLNTVYLGGGTPSLLSVEQLQRILDALERQFGIATDAEITIEMDPGTFDQTHAAGYQQTGINRVSLGVQAFQADILAACGRTHTPDDIAQAVYWLADLGISNFSLDLISGLPYQTLDRWQDSLDRAIALRPTHLSIYDLIVEPGTAFGRWYQPGEAPLPSDELTADLYRVAQRTLTSAGYAHYEISNYAKPEYASRHNQVYWHNQPFYGFGMGAASYLMGDRLTRPRTRQAYYAWVERLESQCEPTERPTDIDILLDTLMLGLRLAEGLNLHQLALYFGNDIVHTLLNTLEPYHQQGWVKYSSQQPLSSTMASPLHGKIAIDTTVRLSDPEGFLFSNVILSALFQVLDGDRTKR